jgi:hypothetical protein
MTIHLERVLMAIECTEEKSHSVGVHELAVRRLTKCWPPEAFAVGFVLDKRVQPTRVNRL